MLKIFDYTDNNKFLELKHIANGPFSNTALASNKETQEIFSQRKITIQQEENIAKFKDICEKLFKMEYPYSIRPSYAVLPDPTNNVSATLYTPYSESQSLKALIERKEQGEIIENFDSTQKLIIIYGILLFLNAIHQDNQLHGRLKSSNILLDSQLSPCVSDAFLYDLNENGPINDHNCKMIDYIVSLPPEIIQNNECTSKSDIYSLGILILQVLTNHINVYEDLNNDCSEIIRLKQEGHLPTLSDVQDQKLQDLVYKCLESDPEKRPDANELIIIIEEIATDESMYDIQRINEFKSINDKDTTDNIEDQTLMDIKKLADEGDVDMMYEYGRKRFTGENDCPCDIQEAKKYISMAAERGNENAKSLFLIIHNDSSINEDKTKPQLENDQAPSSIEQKPQTRNITHLKDDQFFTREKADVNSIINKVKENYNQISKKKKDFTTAKLGKKSFIFTEGAIVRLTTLYYYLKSGVPVLLEGPTGTSKTLSSEIVCQLIGKPLLKFNLSSETKASYLLGRYRGDVDSWAGLSMTVGPFRDAYENGCILLLDEINLASAECLKFIGEALDSKKISVEMPGMPLREIPMHPEFRLIATQNPNKGLFAAKRQDLDPAFLSRFQIIDFPSFGKDELVEIARGLAKSFDYDATDQFIQDFIDFHMTWSSRDDVKGDVQCFTIREIAAAVHALAEGNNCYDTIMTIYGARYKKRQKENLKNLFLKYESFKDMKPSEFEYPDNFPECFHNKNLEEALKAIKFSFDNKRHVILTGSEGNGITQVARWVAQHYNNNNKKNKAKNNNDEFFCVCTEETKCSDLIGSQKPSDNMGSGQELIVFKLGLLTIAIEQGKCVVFDSLDEAPSTVCERLNGLFDEKYDGEKKVFEIPENPQGEPIEIDPDFRMLCTCRIDKINQMSPAFVNRFDVIVLEDQLEDITDDKLKELIELLMKIKLAPSSNSTTDSNNDNINENIDDQDQYLNFGNANNDEDDEELGGGLEEDDEDLGGGLEEEDEPGNEIINNEHENKNTTKEEIVTNEPAKNEEQLNEIEFKPPSDLVDLVFNSFSQIKNETKSNDDQLATMFKLSRLCKAVSKFVNIFSSISIDGSSVITQEKIVKFATDFVVKTGNFDVPKEIEDFFIQKLIAANDNDDGQYFFADSPPLRSHIAKLYAASVINQPLVVYGGTGVGKTSAARAFGRLRRNQQNRSLQCLMLSFHAGTKSNNIYGTTTILNGKVKFVNGPLTTALQKGGTFIADEMNLSTISTMKSMAPALEPCIGEKIFISGVGESIQIHPDFFFVACQNELGTIGRNVIPSSIASRFRVLYYPVQQEKDVSTICVDISKSFYNSSNVTPSFTLDDARNVGKYMIRLNQEKQKIIPQWSLRDVTKLFKRIHHQDEQSDYYHFEVRNTNLLFYHNVLFYTLAPVGKNELKGIFQTILNLIGDTFNLEPETRNELKNSYETEASIQNFGKGSYIMKGNIGISTALFPNFDQYIKEFLGLPSLLECIFQILLSDSSEPILLMGPSGYKTFISKLFLQKAKVIALTQETSVSQLIGSSAFLTKSEAKHFYLDLICRICHIYDGSKITELKDKLSKRKLVKADIATETSTYLKFYPSFATTVHRLTEKLFENTAINSDQSVLSDMVIEFRPGLILLPILQGDCIILKDLSNLQTIVIERFNELLTGKHNITVSEDIHDTITDSNQKELSGFSSFFRVFGTCPPNSAVKLSEAVLSRFTVINTSEYKKDEQGYVLKSYNIINAKKLSDEIIDLIIEFSKSIQNHFKKTMSFTQLINILEISSRLIQTISSIPPKNILGIVLYRIFVGLLERRTEYKEKINTIFNEINVPLPPQFLNPNNESPFLITNKDGFIGLESKITGLFIHSTDVKEVDLNVAYTPSFVDMLDIIHFGILAKIPVILEGNAGQGKQKAIEYVAKHLGYEVVNIVMSKSTKVDDLLGKVSIEPDERNNIHVKTNFTKLAKAIKSNSADNNTIFVFHNLNNASPAVLEKLASLFDRAQSEFSLPDGTTHPKGVINVIGLFNPQNGISNREKLPTSLIYSSIYHIVENPKKQDVLQIIEALFQPTDFRYEVLSFHDKYKITKKFASQNNASSAVTLYDINKYILFRTVTNGYFNEDLISQMLFGYRFLQQETINQVLDQLHLLKMVFQPTFIFNEEKKEVYIKQSEQNDEKSLTLKIQSKQNIEKIKQELRTLTIEQQQCLLFLTCAVLSKRACIVQGSTASGKSHIIRLFANMLGRKLNVYQMNSDSGMSILTGQSVLRNEITEKDKKEFQIAFSDLQTFDELKIYIQENFSIPHKDWKPKQFSDLLERINKYQKDLTISDDEKELLRRAEAKIKQTMSPAKRFHHEESAFIKAMEKGEWVVFEDLGSAPPEIEEKLSSLCGDDPEIDLFESGENNFFSRSKPNSRKIHEDFQVFITYNPSSKTGSRSLDPNFLNKCFSFTLPPLDSTTKSSAELMRGTLMNYKYDNHLAIDLGKRISNVHEFIKKDCLNDKDSYATDSQFTARTLTFILKEFDRHIQKHENSIDSIYKVLCRSFHLYYLNSYINTDKNEKKEQLMNELSKEIDKADFDVSCQGVDQKEKYENLLIDLRNIQLYVTSNSEDKKLLFEFKDFIEKCMNVQFSDISFIYDHLDDTLEIIKESCPINNNNNWPIYENLYTQIQILLNLFKSIKNEMGSLNPQYLNMTLNDNNSLKLPNFKKPILSLYLLYKLTEKDYFYPSTPYILYDEEIVDLLRIIIDMAQDPSKQQFDLFISILKEKHELITEIEKLFPYHLFKDKSHPFYMILYWIPLFKKLYEHQINFQVEIIQTYDFIFSTEYSGILPTYIFKEENSLYLSAGSKFFFPSTNKSLKISSKLPKSPWSKIFFGLTALLFINKSRTFQDFNSKERFEKYKSILPDYETNQFPHLAKLYQQNPDCFLVSKIWSIVFNFPPEIIKILINILHPLESDMIRAISEIYSNITNYQFDHIFDLIKWMSLIGKCQSRLWLIYNNQFKCPELNNIPKIKIESDQIQREIDYLKVSPAFDQNIWLPSKYINKLQTEKIPLDQAIKIETGKDKEKVIRNQLKGLITQLDNANIKDKESLLLKNQIVQQILQISENSPKDENYKRCQERVQNFLDFLKKGEERVSNTVILWPNYAPLRRQIYKETPNIKLYEHVIWFSQVKAIVDKISDPNNQNISNDIFELNKFPEMQYSAHLLTKKSMQYSSEKYVVNGEDKDSINSTLNAHFLMKLENDNLIKYIEKLDETFNDLSLRNEIKEESEIQWIHQKVNQCPPSLNIVLPQFEPQDLFYLFVGYSGDVKKLEKGPSILSIDCKNLLESIEKILFSTPETFNECADKIAKIIYRIIFNVDKVQLNHSELRDQFKQKLQSSITQIPNKDDLQNQMKTRNEVLMKSAIFVLDISEKLSSLQHGDSSTGYKLTHDDSLFVADPKWYTKDDFIQKYPSLVYWLIKYQKYAETLQNIYSESSLNETCLPFWLFTLRLMSSQNCVTLDIDSSTAVSKIITETMNEYIRSYIRSNNLSDLGTGWLSLVLSSVPSDIINHNYRIFYEFFNYLSEDNKINSEILNQSKIKYIKEFTENVCQIVFDKKEEELLNKPFDSFIDKNLAFIYDPNKFINRQIKEFIQNNYRVFLESEKFREIKSNSIQIEDTLNLKISQLEESIKAENNAKKERFIEEQNKKKEAEINRVKNNYLKNIDSYNNKINLLKEIEHKLYNNLNNNNEINTNDNTDQINPNDTIDQPNININIDQQSSNNNMDKLKGKNKNKKGDKNDLQKQKNKKGKKTESIKPSNNSIQFTINMNEFTKYANELNKVSSLVSDLVKTNDDPLILYKPKWTQWVNLRLFLFGINNEPMPTIEILPSKRSEYFFPKTVAEKAKAYTQYGTYYYSDLIFEPVVFNLINEEQNDLNDICRKQIAIFKNNDRIPTLIFGQSYTSDYFVNELKTTINILSSLVKSIEENIKNEKMKKEAFEKPKKISEKFANISSLLTARFTDTTECPIVQDLLTDLKQIYSQLKNYSDEFQKEINKSIYNCYLSFPHLKEDQKLFTYQYQLPLPSQEKVIIPPGKDILFDSVAGAEFLSLPILIVEKDENNKDIIDCCFSSLECQIGPVVPSLYSGKCIMNFISFINEIDKYKDTKISIEVETKPEDEKYKDLFQTRDFINPGEPCQILIKLPTSNVLNEIENISIETNLIIKSINSDLEAKKLHCIFNFQLVPLQILISCNEYPLSFSDEDKAFYLCTHNIHPNTKISFRFDNSLINESCKIAYQLSDFKDNGAEKPDVSYNSNENELSMNIKNVENVTRFHGTLKLKFSENLETSILIDSIIVPFDFGFDLYDYKEKKYVTDYSTIYYSTKYPDREIVLHCRLYGIFSSEMEAKIQNNFNYPVKIVSSKDDYLIHEDSEFDIKIKVQSKVPYYSNTYYISVKIGDIEKKIRLNFEEPTLINSNGDLNEFHKYKKYGFDWKQKEWKELKLKTDNTKDIIYIVSPFNSQNKFDNKSIRNITSVPFVNWEYEGTIYKRWNVLIYNSTNYCYITLNDHGECNTEKTVNYILWSYSTIFGIAENEWYPVFKDYNKYFKSFSMLECTDENINKAKEGLSKIPGRTKGSSVDFIHFAEILRSGIYVLHNLHAFIKKFPPSFHENEFDETLNFMIGGLKTIEESDPFLPIIQYNLIFIFYTIFKKRFDEIKANKGYLCNLIDESVIEQKTKELYQQYNEVDVYAKDFTNDSLKKINKIKKEIKNISLHSLPDEQHTSYEISNSSPSPIPKSKEQISDQITHSTSQNTISNDKNIDIKKYLPEIVIPSESEVNSLSIQSLYNFYQACTQATRLFPTIVKNTLKDSPEIKRRAKEYFLKLLQVYRPLPSKDYSFISTSVNAFTYSFSSMINKFEKAGVDFHELVPKKFIIDEQNLQGLIQYPEKEQLVLEADNWKSKKEFTTMEYQGGQILSTVNSVYSEKAESFTFDDQIPNPEFTEPDSNHEENSTIKRDVTKKEKTFDNFAEVAYIAQINEELKKCNEEEEKYEMNQSDDENLPDNTLTVTTTDGSGGCSQTSLDQERFDGMLKEFTEKDGIERAIASMKRIDRENPLEILPYTSLAFKNEYQNPDHNYRLNDYPIIPLMQQSFIISQEFLKIASDLDLPYSTMCVNILIDCSAYISDENKTFNLLVICALTDALTTLDIPYSAAVIGDQNFKAIIKPFEEPHSYIALQRICDCIHIKRFSAKLPGCIEYAINSMRFPNDERKNRAIFTFTDGLDENLVKTKGWSELFKYSQLSFGFIFIKSSELVEENLAFLENVWDTFEKETNGKYSVVKVAKISADTNLKAQEGNQVGMSNTLRLLLELFGNVMKRTCRVDDDHIVIDRNYKTALFEISPEEKLQSLTIFKEYMKAKYGGNKGLYVQRSDVLKNAKSVIDQVDSKQFYNKLNRITTCQVDNSLKKDYSEFLREFIQSGKNVNRTSLEKTFQPNKASQTILSSTGTDIDITALILNLINPVPDPMIYLEEKGGLIRNYGVTVVIDASYSCFNPSSAAHSFQTIKSVLASLGSIDLPCFDLIIATNSKPIVLCSQLKTSYALAERSQLWDGLFTVLQDIRPSLKHCDLASAIHTAFDLRRMRTMQCTSSMMFVLTDGLYQTTERPRIIECINNCVQSGMITFGIGMGIYPKGIEKLFPQYVFAGNPANVMKGVSDLFTDNYFDYSEGMFSIGSSFVSQDLKNAMKRISDSAERPLFEKFTNELSSITPTIDAFSDFINREQEIGNAQKGFINPQGKDTELYIKDFLKTQKILIVQLCDDTICGDAQLNKKYIFQNYESGRTECINEAVKFFGISLEVVQNYEDAIHEITKTQNVDECIYYAVWIICGSHPEKLPTGQRNSNKYIVEQFIDVLIKFWKNGGSLVFWADNDPYTFHVNLFLNRVRFENEEKCPSGQVTFQIHGNHKGGKILLGDDSGELKKEQIFNRSQQLFKEVERTKISHNIYQFNEGKTLSFVENINVKTDSNYLEKILPFKPFAIDSEGGITILFYTANLKTGTGDIVIDCGFSKLFDELNLEGTFRYIQNLAGWTCRPEVNLRLNRGKKKPWDWRPKAVSHTITNITNPNYSNYINEIIIKLSQIRTTSVLKDMVRKMGGDITGVLRFSIMWNDRGGWDKNDLDAHCIQPNGVELMFNHKTDDSTTGKLDIDITSPEQGVPACENITWTDRNRMVNGTYRFFVLQYSHNNGYQSGFRAEIEFDNECYYYDYPRELPNKSTVDVAYVTLSNGRFSIRHSITPSTT